MIFYNSSRLLACFVSRVRHHRKAIRLRDIYILGDLPKTGLELVTYWQNEGVISSRPDMVDSQSYARKLRHDAETREHIQDK
jgi:hypothetical protein